jgi:hypothetical protein
MPRRLRLLLIVFALALVGLGGAAVGLRAVLSHPLPVTESGPAAEALADRMEAAVDVEAWARTGAVRWSFRDRNRHLWDRQRHLARVQTGERTVLIDLHTRRGRAWEGTEELSGSALDGALDEAWAAWCNDSFWLNPLAKLRDEGTSRSSVGVDGQDALLVSYASGGTTPGDRYLWLLGADDRPTAWRMWVSILPVPGLEASWEGWQQLSTGAWVSTLHRIGPVEIALTEVAGAPSLGELEPGADPFAPLVAP